MKKYLTKNSDYQTLYLFLCVFSAWLINRFSIQIQDIISIFFLLSLGLLHGVFDMDMAQLKGHSKRKVLVVYISFLIAGILLLQLKTDLFIWLLLLISCIHFGEDFVIEKKSKILISVIIGVNQLSWFFTINLNEFEGYMYNLGIELYMNQQVLILLNSGLTLFILSLPIKKTWFILNTALVILLSLSCRLIPAFAIYFSLGHSLPSSQLQIKKLSEYFDKKRFYKILKRGLMVYLTALLILVLFFAIMPELEFSLMALVYLMLLAVPHSFIMHQFES
ncbi:MAG: Brp/Blh family beta-carotene 15,15'-dioxygenase [Flavobacteriaceae bacterium]